MFCCMNLFGWAGAHVFPLCNHTSNSLFFIRISITFDKITRHCVHVWDFCSFQMRLGSTSCEFSVLFVVAQLFFRIESMQSWIWGCKPSKIDRPHFVVTNDNWFFQKHTSCDDGKFSMMLIPWRKKESIGNFWFQRFKTGDCDGAILLMNSLGEHYPMSIVILLFSTFTLKRWSLFSF